MSKDQQKKFLFNLYFLTLVYGAFLIPGLLGQAVFLLILLSEDFSSKPRELIFISSCFSFPLAIVFGLGVAWAAYYMRWYTLALIGMAMPVINLLIIAITGFSL